LPSTPLLTSGFLRARRVLSLATAVAGDAVWWDRGVVQEVGQAVSLARLVPRGTPVYDLPEALVTPGFVDGHTHFAHGAVNRGRVQLAGVRTREAALAVIAAATPVQGWVIGQGWDANGWPHPPDRTALDAIHRWPVCLDSLDVHAAWVNSAALAAAGITRHTADPFGGRIVRDAAGEPSGLLLERAVELMTPHLPVPPEERLDEALREAQAEAHRLGVTGIHDVEALGALAAFERLQGAGALRLRHLLTDIPLVDRHWGQRGRGAYAFRTLLREGSTLVFGSDVPVASIDPREGVFAALERRAGTARPPEAGGPRRRCGSRTPFGPTPPCPRWRGASRTGGALSRRGTMPTSWRGRWTRRSSGTMGRPSGRGARCSPLWAEKS
jgi:predicted amidohydrolase YtcJ